MALALSVKLIKYFWIRCQEERCKQCEQFNMRLNKCLTRKRSKLRDSTEIGVRNVKELDRHSAVDWSKKDHWEVEGETSSAHFKSSCRFNVKIRHSGFWWERRALSENLLQDMNYRLSHKVSLTARTTLKAFVPPPELSAAALIGWGRKHGSVCRNAKLVAASRGRVDLTRRQAAERRVRVCLWIAPQCTRTTPDKARDAEGRAHRGNEAHREDSRRGASLQGAWAADSGGCCQVAPWWRSAASARGAAQRNAAPGLRCGVNGHSASPVPGLGDPCLWTFSSTGLLDRELPNSCRVNSGQWLFEDFFPPSQSQRASIFFFF